MHWLASVFVVIDAHRESNTNFLLAQQKEKTKPRNAWVEGGFILFEIELKIRMDTHPSDQAKLLTATEQPPCVL
jgi:hypothetical protein